MSQETSSSPDEPHASPPPAPFASHYALTGAQSAIKGIDEVLADRVLVHFDTPEDEEMYHRTIAAVRMVLEAASDTFRERLGDSPPNSQ